LSHVREAESLDVSTLHTHLALALHESFFHIISDTLISSLKEKNKSLFGEFISLENGHLLQKSFVGIEVLVISLLVDELWSGKSSTF